MENYQCELCLERYVVQCLNCKGKFCSKHIKSEDKCPKCECYPFNYKENTMINTSTLNFDSRYKCNVCGNVFGGDKNAFLLHIIDKHKDEIINRFNYKSIQNVDINQSIKVKNISLIKSINSKNASFPNQIQNSQQINNKSKDVNLQTHRKSYNIKRKKNIIHSQENSININNSTNSSQNNSRNMKQLFITLVFMASIRDNF